MKPRFYALATMNIENKNLCIERYYDTKKDAFANLNYLIAKGFIDLTDTKTFILEVRIIK